MFLIPLLLTNPTLNPLSICIKWIIFARDSASFILFLLVSKLIFLSIRPKINQIDKKITPINGGIAINNNFNLKDRFSRAFVVSDRLIDALKPDVINNFTNYIVDKMNNEDDNIDVPLHYIENELKEYLNNNFDVNPKIPLR